MFESAVCKTVSYKSFDEYRSDKVAHESVSLRNCVIPAGYSFGKRNIISFFECTFESSVIIDADVVFFFRTSQDIEVENSNIGKLMVMCRAEPKKINITKSSVQGMIIKPEPKSNKISFPIIDDPSCVKSLYINYGDVPAPIALPIIPYYALESLRIVCWAVQGPSEQLRDFQFTLTEEAPLHRRFCNVRQANDAEMRNVYRGIITPAALANYYAVNQGRRGQSIFDSSQTVHIPSLEECSKEEALKMLKEYNEKTEAFSPGAWLSSLNISEDAMKHLTCQDTRYAREEITLNIKAAIFKAYKHMNPSYHRDWIARIVDEIREGYGMCVPGRITRIINSFVGFPDLEGNEMVVMKLSETASIQNIILVITKKNVGKPDADIAKLIRDELTSRGYPEEVVDVWSNF